MDRIWDENKMLTSLVAVKIQIECIGSIEMEKGVDTCIMYTLFLKKQSSRKHWP
jgi:hypothetical protein